MPAGSPFAPFGIPLHFVCFAFFRTLPQHEVERIVLALDDIHALACAQVLQRFSGQFAVAIKFAYRKIHIAVRCPIGQPVSFQLCDHIEHFRHELRGARLMVGALHAQRIGILVHRGDKARGERMNGFPIFRRALDDLVVDVGDVAHVGRVIAGSLEPAVHHVEHHHHARMAKVAIVVHGHAAHIHAHLVRLDGNEFLLVAGESVVDF
jgi:hypothetical protein